MRKRSIWWKLVAFAGLVVVAVLISAAQVTAKGRGNGRGTPPPPRDNKVQRGFEIAPVPLNLRGKNRDLVGLGSYIVNAQAGCIDCHSCPSYAPGDNPFVDGEGRFNSVNYLAGGVPFGPFISANITPDAQGKPAGLTFEEFVEVMREGRDPDEENEILQVMPWPIFRNMTNRDLAAIYEYLRSIPHAEPGTCSGPGQ